jgi:hypothetical protein
MSQGLMLMTVDVRYFEQVLYPISLKVVETELMEVGA